MASLNADERNLNLVQGLYFLGDALAGVFVTVFIFAHTNFQTVLIYTAINFCMLLFIFLISGKIMEHVASGTLVRTGLLLNGLFYFTLFILRDNAVHFLIPIACLDGAAAGFFWSGLNLNQYVFSQHHTRVQYFGYQAALNNSLRAAGPIIGGAVITVLGRDTIIGLYGAYAMLFFAVSIVYILAATFIGKLPEHGLLQFSYHKLVTHRRSFAWNMVLWEHAVYGCFDVLLGTMIGVLTFVVVKKEIILGGTQTVIAVIAAVGAITATRLLKKSHGMYWVGSAGVAIGILGFAVSHDMRGLWFFVIVYGFASAFLPTWMQTLWFHTLDDERFDWQHDFHILVERDIALGIPRILSYVILVAVVGQGNQVNLAWNWLYVLPVFPLILGILFSVHHKYEAEIVPAVTIDE